MIKKIFLNFLLILTFFFSFNLTFATTNIDTDSEISGTSRNTVIDSMKSSDFFGNLGVLNTGEKGIINLLINVARDLRIIVFAVVSLIGVVLVIRLLFGTNTEEEQNNLKKGIIWSTVGIIVMQIAFSVYKLLFDENIDSGLADNFTDDLVEPFIDMLMFLASFVFIAVGIYAFYMVVIAQGEEDKIKKGKMMIIQSMIGFIIIKIARVLVENTYNPNCDTGLFTITYGITVCSDITDNAKIVTSILTWLNTFMAVIVIILIIYAGFLVMMGKGEEDKNKKAKGIMLYVSIGLLVLFTSYIIMTFFINESTL